MKKHVCLDIYDTDGILHETVEGDYDGEELLKEMARAVSEEGLPVVRSDGKDIVNNIAALLKPAERPMVIAWRVGNVSFHADGAAEDVKMQELLFRGILPELLAQVSAQKTNKQ